MNKKEELLKLWNERKEAKSYTQAKKLSAKIQKKLKEYWKK